MIEIEATTLETYLAEILRAVGVSDDDAVLVARSYVSADLHGLSSHGVMRVPRIFAGVDAGTHFPERRPIIVREGPSFALFDGQGGLGVVVGITAMRTAIAKARSTGIACAGVFNSNHFGTAGFYCGLAAEANMIGLTICNGAPGVAANATGRAVLGPNPIAIGAPTRDDAIVLDMSIASIVRGRVLELQRTGQTLPDGVAVDGDGNPTTDPSEALLGAFLPFGGAQAYKAFGLGLMIDILCGPLTGAAYADKVRGSADTNVDCNKGDLYLAIDIAQFRDLDAYLDDIDDLARIVRGSGANVYLPGDVERQRATQAQGVVALDNDMASQLAVIGRRFQVAVPRAIADG